MLDRGTTFSKKKRISKRWGVGGDTNKNNDNDDKNNNKNKNGGSNDCEEDEMIRRLDESRKRGVIDFAGNAKVDLRGVDMEGLF